MHHLSGLDATFLYLETPETPMHVGGLNIVQLPPHSVALNVTVQSYNGLLDFGLTACCKALPDLPKLSKRTN